MVRWLRIFDFNIGEARQLADDERRIKLVLADEARDKHLLQERGAEESRYHHQLDAERATEHKDMLLLAAARRRFAEEQLGGLVLC